MTTAAQTTEKSVSQTPPPGAAAEADKKPPSQADGAEGNAGDPGDDLKFTAEQRAYIEKLRKENGNWRTKFKEQDSQVSELKTKFSKMETTFKKALGLADDKKLSPEEAESELEGAQSRIQNLEMERDLAVIALEQGIGKEDFKYFSFLIQQAGEDLAEGEELDDEAFKQIVGEVKARGGKRAANTTVEGSGDKTPPPAGKGETTLDQFMKMGIQEKSLLYQKNEALYKSLFQQAREKKLL